MILFRSRITLTAADQAAIILDDLDDLESDLNGGAVALVGDGRTRVRRLPLLDHDGESPEAMMRRLGLDSGLGSKREVAATPSQASVVECCAARM